MPVPSDRSLFREMLSAYPVRTGVLFLVPVVFAAVQGANVLVNGGSVPYVAASVLAVTAFAAYGTRLLLASFRTETLEAEIFESQYVADD